jgi:Phage integrase family
MDRSGGARAYLGEEGQHFTLDSFQTYMGRIGNRFKAAGVHKWMAHRNRHWWATESHAAGMSVFDIQAEGGWKDIGMVRRYTKNRPFEELQLLPTALGAVLRALPSTRVRYMKGQTNNRRVR